MSFDAVYAAGATAVLRREDGAALAVERWMGPTNPVDEAIAAAARGPVLDVGCGPGRLLDALKAHGVEAVGIDRSRVAVALGRARGRTILHGDVFDDLPDGWATALVLDGSIGIGGRPSELLARLRAVAASAVVEIERPGAGTGAGRLRLEVGDAIDQWFAWARVDADGITAVAAAAGFTVQRVTSIEGRWFAWLT